MIKRKYTIDELYDFLKDYIETIAKKEINSLIIAGNPGMGKTYTVTQKLKELDIDFHLIKGYSTARALYDELYSYNDKVLVFDDCDSILEDKVAINILKGALDSYEKRTISWLAKNSNNESFEFTGQVIFISNLSLNDIDSAMKSRALTIDLYMDFWEKTLMMKKILKDIMPDYDIKHKKRVLNVFRSKKWSDNIENNINLRTLEKAIVITKNKSCNELKDMVTFMLENEVANTPS